MWKKLKRLFSRFRAPRRVNVPMLRAFLGQHQLFSNVRNAQLYEVNQRLTTSLLDNERTCIKGAKSDSEFARRHKYIADQLSELIELREEILNIHYYLDHLDADADEI